jgi:DNA-binding response OmpR family regulator
MDQKPIVLVAEDDASVRMTIEFVLQDEGFQVVLAEDGEQALHLAQKLLPHVILLDQMMPKLDGHEVLSALQEGEATKDIPVFVLSGMSRTKGDWPGAHFIGKPFSPDELVDRIRKAITPTT